MSDVEAEVRALLDRGDAQAAMALALRSYGPELFGFLVSLHRRRVDAEDVFGEACHDLWRGLPSFDWRCSFRSWAYAVTRNAHHRHLGRYLEKARRNTGVDELDDLATRIRTETRPHQKTENKDRVRALRERLDPDERMLLILRVDRAMSWDDVADAMSSAPVESDAEKKRRAAAMRKRFERLKERLRELAEREGLLELGS